MKIDIWTHRGPLGCPCGPLRGQNRVPGSQNGASMSPKSQIWLPKSILFPQVSQSASQQLADDRGGPAAGAKPYDIRPHPAGVRRA